VNRAEIRANVIATLQEATSPTGWTPDELNRYIDDVCMETARETLSYISTVDLPVTAGQRFVTLPRGTIQCLSFNDKASGKPIDQVDWLWIDGRNRTFARKTNQRPRVACTFGMQSIMIYPAYNTSGTIEAILATNHPSLTSDSDSPRLPVEFHQAVVHGVVHKCMVKDAKGKRLKMALDHLGLWSAGLGDLGEWSRRRHEKLFVANHGNVLRNLRAGWASST
jgi:hypothetical protein